MKNRMSKNRLAIALIVWAGFASAQQLELKQVELPTSKDAKKKGMYVTTTLVDGNIRMFIAYDLKKEVGFDAITVDNTGKLLNSASETASSQATTKYQIEIPSPSEVENPAQGKEILRLVTANGVLGKLKIERGYFEPKYAVGTEYGNYYITYTKVLKGFKFVSENEYMSEMKLNIFAAHTDPESNIERSYNILEGWVPNTVAYLEKNSSISFIGKDARFDKDSPNAQNVLISGKFDGKTGEFSNIQEHVLGYNLINVTSGHTGAGHRSVLVSTLNAPSTIAAHKKWQADGNPYMTYLTFDTDGKVLDNVSFKSNSVRGNFALHGVANDHYVVGSINADHDGYYRMDVGKPTHFQMIKIQNGAVAGMESVSYEQIQSSLLIAPDNKKAKLGFKDIKFTYHGTAPNGDLISCASTGGEYLIFQYDPKVQLKAVYLVDRVPGKDLLEHSVQVVPAGENLYFLFREQAPGMVQGVSKSFSRSSYSYAKNVNFSRVDELTTYGRVVKINAARLACSAPVDFDEDVILGDTPIFEGSDGAVLLPVRSPKRDYKIAVIK